MVNARFPSLKIHQIGKLESPSILKLEFRPNPKKHIILAHTQSMEEKAFFERVSASVAKSARKEAFIFVHGYNVSFESAARRTGQIAHDLQFVALHFHSGLQTTRLLTT